LEDGEAGVGHTSKPVLIEYASVSARPSNMHWMPNVKGGRKPSPARDTKVPPARGPDTGDIVATETRTNSKELRWVENACGVFATSSDTTPYGEGGEVHRTCVELTQTA
jgi:hypothetical protein